MQRQVEKKRKEIVAALDRLGASALPWYYLCICWVKFFLNILPIIVRKFRSHLKHKILYDNLLHFFNLFSYVQFISSYQYENKFGISLSLIGETAILIMEAAILDGGTRNAPIAVAPIARIERGYAMLAAVYLQCITVHSIHVHTSCTKYNLYTCAALWCIANRPQPACCMHPIDLMPQSHFLVKQSC